MLERPPRCRVPDDENAGAGEARTHVAEEVAHALDGVTIALPARKRLIDGLPPERCHTLDWAAVQHPVVAFAEACVLVDRDPRITECDLCSLDCAAQIGREDRREPVVPPSLAEFGREPSTFLGQLAGQPPR